MPRRKLLKFHTLLSYFLMYIIYNIHNIYTKKLEF